MFHNVQGKPDPEKRVSIPHNNGKSRALGDCSPHTICCIGTVVNGASSHLVGFVKKFV